MKELKLTITHYKLLDTIKWLKDKKLYATAMGIFKIVHGNLDEDTVNITDCPTFGTLISYGSKKISRYLLALYRYKFIAKIYDRKTDEMYFVLNIKGLDSLEVFHKKHPLSYKKVERKFKRQIVELFEEM